MAAVTVASVSDVVAAMKPDWDLAAALLGGTRTMRAAAATYLPRWPNEAQEAFTLRLKTAVLFPAYKRTISTLSAKPFSKPVTRGDDVPSLFEPWLLDIDMEGRNLDMFAADLMQRAMGYGLSGILVDYPDAKDVPTTAAGVRLAAAEAAAGLRPYWVHIWAENILGWRASRRAGAWVLDQLRLMETVEEADGEWGVAKVQQVRVLEPGKWRTYRRVKDKPEEWVLHTDGRTTLDFVPFVPVYGERTGFMTGVPPLIEVANLNVAHWQSASDQQNILHTARVPILVAIGVQEKLDKSTGQMTPFTFTIGGPGAIDLPLGADMKYVEHTGRAIEAGAKDLDTLENRMRQAGAELLVIGAGAKTRIEAFGDNEMAMSALQRITLALEDALDLALYYTAKWVKEPEGGHVTLFNDHGAASLSEATAQLVSDMAAKGQISKQRAYEEQQRRGILSTDKDWEDEQADMDAEGPPLGEIGLQAAVAGGGLPAPMV